ncbi:MAG: hypothetical protein JXM73_18590 [Anaerolineae bacterium]|nr:hypothetical protein [Anaerolineae bacterium]
MQSKKVEPARERKEYKRPDLKCYGTLVEITQNVGDLDDDGTLGTAWAGL